MSAVRRAATLLHKTCREHSKSAEDKRGPSRCRINRTDKLPRRRVGHRDRRSMLALQYAHTGRDGQRRERHHDRDDAGQYTTYALEPHRIGHAALHWKVVFFGLKNCAD